MRSDHGRPVNRVWARSICGWEDRERMRKQDPRKERRPAPKTVLRLPDLDQAKSAVLNSLTSADAQRGYRHAIDEFVE